MSRRKRTPPPNDSAPETFETISYHPYVDSRGHSRTLRVRALQHKEPNLDLLVQALFMIGGERVREQQQEGQEEADDSPNLS